MVARAARAAGEMAHRTERRKLVSILARVIPAPARPLGDVLEAVAHAGLFRRGAVLVGTGACQTYAPMIGAVLPAATVMTQDADLATADLALDSDSGDTAMIDILRCADHSFSAVMELDPMTLPSRFRSRSGFLVDLLTPALHRTDPNPMPLDRLKAGAVPLQQLGWLLEGAVDTVALHGAGVPVRVPAPARFAVHKLLIAPKRDPGQTAKRRKDLLQAKALIEALSEVDPFSLDDALADARRRGEAGWAGPISRSLREL